MPFVIFQCFKCILGCEAKKLLPTIDEIYTTAFEVVMEFTCYEWDRQQPTQTTDIEELVETFSRENDIEIRPGDVFMFVRSYKKLDDSEKDLSPEEATHWEISRLWQRKEDISGHYHVGRGVQNIVTRLIILLYRIISQKSDFCTENRDLGISGDSRVPGAFDIWEEAR